ncbi:MAG: hypothetical protein Kow00108_10320 [Calditrichia bacterium]
MKNECLNILLFLDGDLPDGERSAFENHLRHCSACQSILSELSDYYAHLPEIKLNNSEIDELWLDIEKDIEKSLTMPEWVKYVLYAAAILLFVFNLALSLKYIPGSMDNSGPTVASIMVDENGSDQAMLDDFIYEQIIYGDINE